VSACANASDLVQRLILLPELIESIMDASSSAGTRLRLDHLLLRQGAVRSVAAVAFIAVVVTIATGVRIRNPRFSKAM
jgi:hypothetical protein